MGRLDNEENVIKDMHEVTSDQIMLLSGSKFEKRLIELFENIIHFPPPFHVFLYIIP